MSELERDLRRRINARHKQWIIDSLELYEMAGLHHSEALISVLSVIIDAAVSAAVIFEMPADDLADTIRKAVLLGKKESRQ